MSKFEKMIRQYTFFEREITASTLDVHPTCTQNTIIFYYSDRDMKLEHYTCKQNDTNMDIIKDLFAIAGDMIEWSDFERWRICAFEKTIDAEEAEGIWYDQLKKYNELLRLFGDDFDWFFEAYQQDIDTTL